MHWIDRIEAEYDQPIYDILQAACDQAEYTGTSIPMLAEEFGVSKAQVAYLCLKLDIKWPRYISSRYLENAAKQGPRNGRNTACHHATIDGKRDTVVGHAKRLGINPSTAIWRITHWNCTPEEALLMPIVSHRERGQRGMSSRYGRNAA